MIRIFTRLWLAILYFSSAMPVFAGGTPCWYWQDGSGMTRHMDCLQQFGNHSLRIKPKLLPRLVFEGKYATVFTAKHGWMYVTKAGDVVVEGVMEMDNGADYIRDGFVRYQLNGKCGYASLGNQETITPQFDGCLPFSGGKAIVCNGCRSVATGEYHSYKGGESFCINTKAQRVKCGPDN